MSNLLEQLLLTHKSRFERLFEYHPNKDEILEKIMSRDITGEEASKAFEEAEFYRSRRAFQHRNVVNIRDRHAGFQDMFGEVDE